MAGEFGWMDDWDLQAVVRGCSASDNEPSLYEAMDYFGQPSFITEPGDNILWNFSDLMETSSPFVDDLEELYKAFYPQATSTASSPVVETANSPSNPEELRNDCLGKVGDAGPPAVAEPVNDGGIHQGASKYRRRKNLHNKVVRHVKADDVSSDVWAWRKYGQKPIKGSPYPRSYYRCSSSKGCTARKQVERSNSDPHIFIVTYTGEHNHSHPTRRNALAGSTRTKFSKKPINNPSQSNGTTAVKEDPARASCEFDDSPSSSSSTTLSPSTTPLVSTDKIDHGQQTTRIDGDEGIMRLEQQMSDDLSSIIFGDDLFMGFEEMNGMMGLDFQSMITPLDGRGEFDKFGGY